METEYTQKPHPHTKRFWFALTLVVLLTSGVFAYMYTRIVSLNERLLSLSNDLASTTATLHDTAGEISKNLSDLHSQTDDISKTLGT